MSGDTFTFFCCVKAVGFASKLKTALSKVLIHGASAGAIVRGHDIESAQVGPEADENTADLRDLNALDFVGGCNVYAHSILDQSQVLVDFCKKSNRSRISLSKKVGAFIDDQKT